MQKGIDKDLNKMMAFIMILRHTLNDNKNDNCNKTDNSNNDDNNNGSRTNALIICAMIIR